MSDIQSNRATGRAFFTDINGSKIIDFQFAPFTLNFEEGGNYEERIQNGRHFTDAVWVSGKANTFELSMFVDRTNESVPSDEFDKLNDELKRFPNRQFKYNSLEATNLIRALGKPKKPTYFKQSEYNANPDFAKGYDNSNGVYTDLEKLLYFVRPEGISVSDNTIRERDYISTTDFEQYRFVAPPMVRFHYGSIWRECYMTNVRYVLSAMDKRLIPRRFEAEISLMSIRWGYLNSVKSYDNPISTDVDFGKGTDNSRIA